MNDVRRLRTWLLFIVSLSLACWWIWVSRVPTTLNDVERIPAPRENFPAPDFTLTSLTGEVQTLAGYRGQVVVLNLWASWCLPCRAEMPALQKIYLTNKARGLEIVAVNSTLQDNEAAARAFARELNLSFTVLLDREDVVSRRYLLRALPSTFFIDRRGVIRTVIIGGPLSEALLQSKVEELLNEP